VTVKIKVQPIDRNLVVRLTGTDETRSAMIAEFAREKLAEGEQINSQVLGRVPAHETFVDGRLGASEDSVRPDGVIVYEFELTADALGWIATQLLANSPVGSGHDSHPGLYQRSHALYADGVEVDPDGEIPNASEYVFLNSVPYSRKIEAGESRQAPDGVYEGIAAMAQSRFGNSLKISFTYRAPENGQILNYVPIKRAPDRHRAAHERDLRQPAIVVTVR
jgi:hypothetical protein